MPKTVTWTGVPSRGVGLSFLPRCLIQVESYGTDCNAKSQKQQLPGTKLNHKVIQSYLADESGNLPKQPDNSLVGMVFDHLILDVGIEGASKDANEIREADMKAAMVAHGAPREQVDVAAGSITIREDHFDGKSAWLIYDPPKEGATGNDAYPEIRYLRPNEVNDYKASIKRVPWPMDNKKTRASAAVAVQGGGGQFIAGAPAAAAPAGLARAGLPAATPGNGAPAGQGLGGFMGQQPAATTPPAGTAPQSW